MVTKPREVSWAVSLWSVALAIGPVITAMDWSHLKRIGSIAEVVTIQVITIQVLTLLFVSFLVWKTSQGKNWARITLLALFALGLPFFFFYLKAEFERSAILAILSILQALMQGAGLLLIFISPARNWFKKPAKVLAS